jgi:hypothetical protein
LQRLLNFTIELTTSNDGKLGALETDNKTWDGLIGMLIRNESDLVSAALTHNSNRADFTTAINREVLTIIAPAKINQIVLCWVYLSLFQPSSWAFCVAMIVAASVGFFIIDRSGINHFHKTKESFSILNGLAIAGLLFMQLSYTVVSNSFSSKILLLATALATYILYSFLSGAT